MTPQIAMLVEKISALESELDAELVLFAMGFSGPTEEGLCRSRESAGILWG